MAAEIIFSHKIFSLISLFIIYEYIIIFGDWANVLVMKTHQAVIYIGRIAFLCEINIRDFKYVYYHLYT